MIFYDILEKIAVAIIAGFGKDMAATGFLHLKDAIEDRLRDFVLTEKEKELLSLLNEPERHIFIRILQEIPTEQATSPKKLAQYLKKELKKKDVDVVFTIPSEWVTLICGVLAAVTGGVLWNILCLLFKWPYYVCGVNGFAAFIWGIITTLPIPICALIAYERKLSFTGKQQLIALIYVLISGIAAAVFYNSEIRSTIENLQIGYGPQESAIVIIYSIVLSLPPYLVSMYILKPESLQLNKKVFFAILPVLCSLCAVLVTLIIDLPVSKVEGIRALVVAIALRASMFCALLSML